MMYQSSNSKREYKHISPVEFYLPKSIKGPTDQMSLILDAFWLA